MLLPLSVAVCSLSFVPLYSSSFPLPDDEVPSIFSSLRVSKHRRQSRITLIIINFWKSSERKNLNLRVTEARRRFMHGLKGPSSELLILSFSCLYLKHPGTRYWSVLSPKSEDPPIEKAGVGRPAVWLRRATPYASNGGLSNSARAFGRAAIGGYTGIGHSGGAPVRWRSLSQ